ncbi:hypothetical protein [Haliangium sp.]|uniref:hypothetical protein n=1 Tax=Haliangium sp. TaxID=2663208 RepID=UPI003D10693F
MGSQERTRIVVTDAGVLINLAHVDRLSLLGSLPAYEFVVPPEVVAEVLVPEQAEALARALDAGHVAEISFTTTAELDAYVHLVQVLGKGEASCLAIAEVQGWCVACDERRKFLKLARERLGPDRVLNTAGIYVLALRAGLVSIDEADADKHALEKHRFKMKFASFRDVLGSTEAEKK